MQELDLKSFKEQMTTLVWEFETQWKENHNKNPDDYPLTLPENMWHEQFLTWLSME